MTQEKDTFENAFSKLKEVSEKIREEETSLEDSIRYYEGGMEYYKKCNDILKRAEQKIEYMDTDSKEPQ